MDLLTNIGWKYGGPREFWLKNAAAIKHIIEANKLTAVSAEVAHAPNLTFRFAPEAFAPAAVIPHRIPFPGGLRVPHLHFEGNAYLVSEEQWRAFSTKVVDDFKARLEKANRVSFDQVMAISEAVDALGAM